MKQMNKNEFLELIKEYNILLQYIENKEKDLKIDFLAEFKYDIITKDEAKIRLDLLDFIIKNTKYLFEDVKKENRSNRRTQKAS
jgi:hypothetical protein